MKPEPGREEQTVTPVREPSDLLASVLLLLQVVEDEAEVVVQHLIMTETDLWTRSCWKEVLEEEDWREV